ncbi:MAG: MBL fold metallo-hydrolase [Rikenellaceae bacterium]|nr:MBL fold metallo-hydrolase [Rikenellaceae bacterium]MDE7133682.1 MBL fold metallo-hydrolase [Rikenellaceae bacterium]MDE7355440.1 MBL fold metallo-hydrolase [Rikenellaceae bacterium]
MITVKTFPCNMFRELCYVVGDSSGEAVVIDCGAYDDGEFARICEYIDSKGLRPVMALCTHGHVDHITGVKRLKERYGIPLAMDGRDIDVLESAPDYGRMFGMPVTDDMVPAVDVDLSVKDDITFGDTVLRVLHTPGHTPGGVSFFEPESATLFVGDTLFAGSVGRTDLPGGDYDSLMESITKTILPLGGDVRILPGHGNSSTLAHEAAYNPFVYEVLRGSVDMPEVI